MSHSNTVLLDLAVEITKAYAESNGQVPLDVVLEDVYKKLKELNKDVE